MTVNDAERSVTADMSGTTQVLCRECQTVAQDGALAAAFDTVDPVLNYPFQ